MKNEPACCTIRHTCVCVCVCVCKELKLKRTTEGSDNCS